MKEKLRGLKVGQKLKKAFGTILIAFIGAIIVALSGIVMINMNLNRFYKESYHNMQLQLEIRRDIQLIGKNVLWAISANDGTEKEKLNAVVTYSEYVADNTQALTESFHDTELTSRLNTALAELKTERLQLTGLITSGQFDAALERYNGTYTDAINTIQEVLSQIGESADAQAATAYSRASSLTTMIIVLLVAVGVICIALCARYASALADLLLTPIRELQTVAQKLRGGELDIDITYENTDEFGELAQNFRDACAQMRNVIEDMGSLLHSMAEKNFNINTQAEEYYTGTFSILLENIRKMNRELNTTLEQINQSSGQVMTGSGQLARSAQSLAEGATEQAGAVEELMATIANVTSISNESAENAETAADTAKASAENAAKSREEINALTDAMERINATSKEIENIISAIEDIAAQTSLLSLNASIEAARAGDAGRGFAVVADQIGKLAADSAQSAVNTRDLISKSLSEIESGSQIVEHTTAVIASVLEDMAKFATMASGAAESSKTQAAMLQEVEQGVEQISTVVESNSAAAQETSAISEELSAQAQTLEQMISTFEFRA